MWWWPALAYLAVGCVLAGILAGVESAHARKVDPGSWLAVIAAWPLLVVVVGAAGMTRIAITRWRRPTVGRPRGSRRHPARM